jgi:uncharacterized protein
MFFVNKQKEVQSQISEYCASVLECMDNFQDSVKHYCADTDRNAAKISFAKVHKAESKADDIRREIEVMMYSKSLFPESRGDIMGLLETMDRVPNQAESAIRMIWNQYVTIPEQHSAEILNLVDVCCRAVDAMIESAEKLFSDFTNAAVALGKIDELESEADRIEAALIEQVFSEKVDSISTIVFRDFIKCVAQISDRAENVGDRIRIIIAKRTI